MKRMACFAAVVSALAIGGCDNGGGGTDSGMIMLDDGGTTDAQPMADAGRDSGPPATCGSLGRVGGECRGTECSTGLECLPELAIMSGEPLTFRNAFGIGQGRVGADGEVDVVDPPEATLDVQLEWPGTLCSEQCDTTADINTMTGEDMCGSCAHCYDGLGEGSGAQQAFGINIQTYLRSTANPSPPLEFLENTGICRLDCEFNPETNGGCPTGYTCAAWYNVCVEACASDAQCNSFAALARDGTTVVVVDPTIGQTCNMTTGRCEWDAPATGGNVGDTCEGTSDCAADTGACLRGGTCAATQCDGSMIECGGGEGICLGAGGNLGTICVQGCVTSMDCNPGNACLPITLTAEGMAMTDFRGYCLGLCDNGMSGGDDTVIACRTDEQCDMGEEVAGEDADGVCRPTCMPDAGGGPGTGCETGEFCEAVMGQTYGFCRALDGLCLDVSNAGEDNQDGDEGCTGGQICDLTLGIIDRGNSAQVFDYGRCRTECDAAGAPACPMGTTCDTAGTHLCRQACGTGMPDCAAGFGCSAAGFCEQLIPCGAGTPPAPCPTGTGTCTMGFCR